MYSSMMMKLLVQIIVNDYCAIEYNGTRICSHCKMNMNSRTTFLVFFLRFLSNQTEGKTTNLQVIEAAIGGVPIGESSPVLDASNKYLFGSQEKNAKLNNIYEFEN